MYIFSLRQTPEELPTKTKILYVCPVCHAFFYSPKELLKIYELKLDIIHTQTEFSLGTFGKTLAKFCGIPLVHTYHTMYEDYVHYIVNGALISRSMAHSFSKHFCNSANAVIAPTEKVKTSLQEYGVTRPISIIHCRNEK